VVISSALSMIKGLTLSAKTNSLLVVAMSSELVKHNSFEGWIVHGVTVFGGVALENQLQEFQQRCQK